ncbi:MAG: sialate O-acetylesterase, partial [Planctomycetales bacterium]|nr:sialate O-acetylesterase [Planctomycetales bacterium]
MSIRPFLSFLPRWTATLATCWLVAVSLSHDATADVRLPQALSDHMVLQRDQPISVWGWADKDEEVTVTLADKTGKVTAGEDGKWRLKLGALPAGGPHELKVNGKNEIVLQDILVGEVWVCSGQSNMEWPLTRTLHPEVEIAAADHPNIRLLNIPHVISNEPVDDIGAKWQPCTSDSVAGFSAVGYFFGRHLHKTLNVPVGLIGTNWGGTRAEAWTS